MKGILLSTLLFFVLPLLAGHHFESALAKKYPQLDLTDIFVFKASVPGKTVFIMSFNPQSKKDSLSNYASNGIYRFCIGKDATFKMGFSPTFTFKGGKIQFYWNDKAQPKISDTGTLIAEGPINRQLELSNGIKLWTGTVLDLFQGNALGIAAFKNKASQGIYDLSTFDVGEKGNIFANLPSTVIVLEIPNELLSKKIFYYATTAVEMEPNHWHRVNRIAHVLFPHLYLLEESLMSEYNEANHEVNEELKSSIHDNVLKYVTIAGYQKDPKTYTNGLLKRIYPDVLTYNVGSDAVYSIPRINGRPLQADAMNVALALLVGSSEPIDDKVAIIMDRYQAHFPYVVPIDNAYSTDIIPVEVSSDKNKMLNSKILNIKGVWIILSVLFVVVIATFAWRFRKQ